MFFSLPSNFLLEQSTSEVKSSLAAAYSLVRGGFLRVRWLGILRMDCLTAQIWVRERSFWPFFLRRFQVWADSIFLLADSWCSSAIHGGTGKGLAHLTADGEWTQSFMVAVDDHGDSRSERFLVKVLESLDELFWRKNFWSWWRRSLTCSDFEFSWGMDLRLPIVFVPLLILNDFFYFAKPKRVRNSCHFAAE